MDDTCLQGCWQIMVGHRWWCDCSLVCSVGYSGSSMRERMYWKKWGKFSMFKCQHFECRIHEMYHWCWHLGILIAAFSEQHYFGRDICVTIKCPNMLSRGVLMLCDTGCQHVAHRLKDILCFMHWNVLDFTPYTMWLMYVAPLKKVLNT
jgi:hypothetical protein